MKTFRFAEFSPTLWFTDPLLTGEIRVVRQVVEKTLCLNGRHAPGPCGGHCLTKLLVLNIAGGKDTGNIGLSTVFVQNLARVISLQLIGKTRGVRLMADGDKDAIASQFRFLFGF